MKVNISHNKLRLLSRHFMVIVPAKVFYISAGTKVTITADDYGDVGIAECVQSFKTPVYDVKPLVSLLCYGDDKAIDRLKSDHNLFNNDEVIVCTFHFVRRYDAAFQKMIEPESKNIGLNFSFQSQLFQ